MPGPFRITVEHESLFVLGVTGTELVDPSCGVHQRILAGEEGVARGTHLHLDDGIFVPILPLLGLFALSTALAEEPPIRGQVLENDHAIVVGVDAFFHVLRCGRAKVQWILKSHKGQKTLQNWTKSVLNCHSLGYNEHLGLDKIHRIVGASRLPCDGFK